MNRRYLVFFSFIFIVLIAYIIYQQGQIAKLKLFAEQYAIRSSVKYAKKQAEKDIVKCKYIAEREGVDWKLLYAIRLYEAGARNYEMGVKRISKEVIKKYSPDLWQFAAASRIIKQEYRDFAEQNIKEFIEFLARRYNYKHKKNWSKNVYKNYKKIKEMK